MAESWYPGVLGSAVFHCVVVLISSSKGDQCQLSSPVWWKPVHGVNAGMWWGRSGDECSHQEPLLETFPFIIPRGGSKCIGVKRKSERLEIMCVLGIDTSIPNGSWFEDVWTYRTPCRPGVSLVLVQLPAIPTCVRCCCGTHQPSSSAHPVSECTPLLLLCNGTRTEIVGYAFIIKGFQLAEHVQLLTPFGHRHTVLQARVCEQQCCCCEL